ncbi:class I SAM-dependent methyltransferase [Maridesulfovibrio sp.]|uniref:class I SAM-dependent methyltransferase n=1 Tax=Maridesulfovibrio sp. TaxID=2795000 RepID=UPI002A18B48E|nr:class I SAM-dependent methyltransferase [Maridesulfovibrio sp.]
MNKGNKAETGCRGGHGKHGRGPSSYWMQDPEKVLIGLGLMKGMTFLDLGCGPGDYSVQVAGIIGPRGVVYGLDLNADRLRVLESQALEKGLQNIRTVQGDMLGELPFEDGSIDLCLMSTSLHCMDIKEHGVGIFSEIRRILSPSGQVAVLECKKEKSDSGPPLHMRISDKDIKAVAEPLGFRQVLYADFGFNYLIRFKKI